MSSITIAEAQNLSAPELRGRYYFKHSVVDQLIDVLPFEYIAGHALKLNLAEAGALADHATIVGSTAAPVPTSIPALSEVETALAHFAARVAIDSLVADQYSSLKDVVAAQIQLKGAAILALYQNKLVSGDSTTAGEFDGLIKLAGAFTIGADNANVNGGTVRQGEIEQLLNLLSPVGGVHNRYLVMATGAFEHLHRNNYSQHIFVILHPDLGPLPAISGVPILLDDYVPVNQLKGANINTTSIFAVNLCRDSGLCGLIAESNREREIRVRGPYPKQTQDTAIFELAAQLGLAEYREPSVAALDGVAWQN